MIKPTENCSICLDNRPNIMTNCHHYYHAKCIGMWFDKNTKCPICNSTNFNPLIIYCTSCNYKILGLKIGYNPGHHAEEFNQYSNILCESCQPDQPDQPQR